MKTTMNMNTAMNAAMNRANDKNTIYLVTSAAGFLGGVVVRKLLEQGRHVRGFVLKGDPAIRFVPKEAEIFEGDLCSPESVEEFFRVPEGTKTICLHIASLLSMDVEYNQKVMDVNVGGCRNILDSCARHIECEKLVYVSSTGAIPELPHGQKITEVDHFDSNKVLGCYSQSKAIATQMVLDAVRDYELNACVVHPTGILGPGDYAVNDVTTCISRILNGELPAGIDGSFNLVDVRDLADGIIAAADKGRKGECYILGNDKVTFREFATILAEEAGVKPVKHFLPIWAANLMAKMMEVQAKRKKEKPLMTTFSIYNLARNNDFDSSKAKKELGFQTRSYRETLNDQIDWLKQIGLLKAEDTAA